jgi:hypothetical protein
MEDDVRQLYEAVLKMNEKLAQVNSKNEQMESIINAMSQYILENKGGEDITEQEMIVLDPFNLGGYKNISSANGSVFKVKSKSLCVNGRHTVEENAPVLLCSKCGGIVCYEHDKGLSPPLCINCIRKEIEDLGLLEIYVLNAVNQGISINDLRKALKGSYKEFNQAQSKLLKEGYMDKDLLFRKILTVKGNSALALGSKVYDLSFMQQNGS